MHIAIRENASLWLLHVFRVPDYAATHFQWGPQDCRCAEQEAQANLSAVEKEVLDRGIKTKVWFRIGHPFEEIVTMAEDPEVDLVLIGSHGCSAIKALLLGSTAARVVERARCPALVVKERFPSAQALDSLINRLQADPAAQKERVCGDGPLAAVRLCQTAGPIEKAACSPR
jgi:nucleotide-binding universal stress UspA family protein